MAKSLRSKWKRKMRAVKRERYGQKELKRLEEMLEKAGDYQFCPEVKEEEMAVESPETPTPADNASSGSAQSQTQSKKIKGRLGKGRKSRIDENVVSIEDDETVIESEKNAEKMSVDGERIFNKRTMRDQYGNYPDWMNKRKMRTQQKKNKRLKKKRAMSMKRK